MTPLTDDEITKMHRWLTDELPNMWANGTSTKAFFKEFVYMIERHHGVREN